MTLSQTIKTIAEQKALASQDISELGPMARPGAETNVQMAKREVERLTRELSPLVLSASGGIFVSGPNAKAFAEVAEDEGGTVTIDASKVYETITDAVERTMQQNGTREWRLDIIQTLMSNLMGLGDRLKVRYMPPLNTTKYSGGSFPNRASTLAMVRDVVRAAVGDELNALVLRMDLVDEVIKSQYDKNIVPVVVINAHPDDIAGLSALVFEKKSITVTTTDQEVTKDDVLTAFKHLKPLITKRKSN